MVRPIHLCLAVLLVSLIQAADKGIPAEYLGGTLPGLSPGAYGSLYTNDGHSLIYQTKQALVRIPYQRINQLEYGQKVDRRYVMAILVSPLLLAAKKREHFLTVGYTAEDGAQQAVLLRVEKQGIRAALVSLEARSGRKIVYQDEEARKAGKG